MHAIWDGLTATPLIATIDLAITGLFLILFIANSLGHERFARLGTLVVACGILLAYSSVVPKENGVSTLFIALISLPFVLFRHENKKGRWATMALITACYLSLEITDYKLFGEVQLLEEPDRVSFVVNFLTTSLLMYFALLYIAQAYSDSNSEVLIRERKQERLTREIQEQNSQLKKANEELDRFVYSVSHDLRAPLRSLLGLMNLLKLEHPPENIQPYLEMMNGRIDHLDAFIRSITEYSRNARLAVQLEEIDMKELLNEVIENQQFTNTDDKVKLFYSLEFDKPIRSDRQRIIVIVSNLVGNAVKYHHPNQLEPYVQIKARIKDHQLILQVTDNGSGLEPGVRDKIFDMFYRGDERSDGSGLGLYIVRETVEKMNGEILVDSAPSVGSTFTVKLPLGQLESGRQRKLEQPTLSDSFFS